MSLLDRARTAVGLRPWLSLAVLATVVSAIGMATVAALFGSASGGLAGPAVIAVGGVLSARSAEREVWRLGRRGRRAALTTLRTGLPSGDARADEVALHRLRRLTAPPRQSWAQVLAGGALVVAVALLAAVRDREGWLAVPLVLLLGPLLTTPTVPPAALRLRRDRLAAALGGQTGQ